MIISGIVLVLLLVFWKAISKYLVLRKIKYLETKKNVLNNLIQKVQVNYFKDKNASENEYRIKIKTFDEMIRDINRQIPLLKEEIAKISKSKIALSHLHKEKTTEKKTKLKSNQTIVKLKKPKIKKKIKRLKKTKPKKISKRK